MTLKVTGDCLDGRRLNSPLPCRPFTSQALPFLTITSLWWQGSGHEELIPRATRLIDVGLLSLFTRFGQSGVKSPNLACVVTKRAAEGAGRDRTLLPCKETLRCGKVQVLLSLEPRQLHKSLIPPRQRDNRLMLRQERFYWSLNILLTVNSLAPRQAAVKPRLS